MRRLIRLNQHKGCDFFGVVSHSFQNKIFECSRWGKTLKNHSKNAAKKYNKQSFSNFLNRHSDCDLISMTTHAKHSTFAFADKYHPEISKIGQLLINKLGFDIDVKKVNNRVIYFNYFVAKPDIYEDYINNWLAPAMHLMLNDEELHKLCMKDANYKKLPKHLASIYNIDYYPYFAFIAERLITLYTNYNDLRFASW